MRMRGEKVERWIGGTKCFLLNEQGAEQMRAENGQRPPVSQTVGPSSRPMDVERSCLRAINVQMASEMLGDGAPLRPGIDLEV